jgi:hypothetical protein
VSIKLIYAALLTMHFTWSALFPSMTGAAAIPDPVPALAIPPSSSRDDLPGMTPAVADNYLLAFRTPLRSHPVPLIHWP